ncbi:MAG TPA: hypothetical protein VLH75_17945 [Longimicrobiales bacterium]|nr:hypothetical protein [Longimicrobiales bacterium]
MRRAGKVLGAVAAVAVVGIAWGAAPAVPEPGAPATGARAAPTSVVLGYYQCIRSEVGKVDAFMAEVQAPLMDALVREGLWLRWSWLTHRYGDEWNRVIVYEAPDLQTHLRASAELTRRLAEAHPGPNPFVQFCDAHKDNLYTRTLP